jgi:hypothetical protein
MPIFSRTQKVSFGYSFEFKNFKGLPCPCCGKTMTTPDEANAFYRETATASGEKLISGLVKFQDRLPETEQKVLSALIEAAKKHPEQDLQQLLSSIKPEKIQNLEGRQKKILSEISLLANNLQGSTAKNIKKNIGKINNIILNGRNNEPFKRKTMLKGFSDIKDRETNYKNLLVLEKIMKKAEEMPSSTTDADAFVAKYSRRSSLEIANKLIEPSTATAEHIKPHSEGGADDPQNFLAECKRCNNDRATTSYADWLEIHPEMKQNAQTYMDTIIDRISSGEIKGYDYYPQAVKKAVYIESEHLIDLDISKSKTAAK